MEFEHVQKNVSDFDDVTKFEIQKQFKELKIQMKLLY